VLGDFETIKRSNKNITVILTRNDNYGWIRAEAILLDDVDAPWTTDFGAVDYIKIAEGFGFETARITSEDQIEATLAEAINNPGANFIEMMVPSQDKIIPFVPPWVDVARERKLPYFY
jgi:acetolactate synthase-1/2/3 large subunit